MKTRTYEIKGIGPMLMRSDRLADPTNDFTKAIKNISNKRKKTEDDHAEIAALEWRGSLYHDAENGIHVPGFNVHAALYQAAKMHKMGPRVKGGVIVQESTVPLNFDGPKDPDKLYADKRFVDIRTVGVSGKRVARCRPIFSDWSLRFTVLFDEGTLQTSDLDRLLEDAGRLIGLGDYRPRFGRFEVVRAQ